MTWEELGALVGLYSAGYRGLVSGPTFRQSVVPQGQGGVQDRGAGVGRAQSLLRWKPLTGDRWQ